MGLRRKMDEKKEKDTINKKKTKKLSFKQKQNRQIMWAVVLMASIILIILIAPFIVKNFINKFDYINLDFQKTKLGEILFYSTRIPVAEGDKITGFYSMNFRNDPRKLEEIEIDVPKNIITFMPENKTVYVSLNPGMEACEDNTIALLNFAGFFRDFANKDVKSGVSDKKYAEEMDMRYITCDNSPDNTVIEIYSGEKTIIKQTEKNCYIIMYGDCDEVLPVTEKFMLLVLESYMGYFTKENDSFLDVFK